jgi:hypothetical protein
MGMFDHNNNKRHMPNSVAANLRMKTKIRGVLSKWENRTKNFYR